MQRWLYAVLAAALVVMVGVFSCTNNGSLAPKPGDTVTPVWASAAAWNAGEPGHLGVRLQAQGKDDSQPRGLDFIRGVSADPAAAVTFFKDDEPLGSPVMVPLSHRC